MEKKVVSIVGISLVVLGFGIMASGDSGRYFIAAATSGFGDSITHTLATQGHSLMLGGRDERKLRVLKDALEAKHKGHYTIALFDYTDLASIERLGKQLKDETFDGLVVIPARFSLSTSRLLSPDEWLEMFNVGFIAPMELIKALLPALRDESSIVIIDGVTSVCYIPEYKNLNVLRKMWIAQIKNLMHQFSHHKIRVNAVSPGVILTEYHTERVAQRADQAQRTVNEQLLVETQHIPLNRYGQPEDIANAVSFLLSNASAHVNGINMVIDGGLSSAY
jgi:3-oxoacyl-[acyl-carrier protein] reductase